jgi:hypothetical protein
MRVDFSIAKAPVTELGVNQRCYRGRTWLGLVHGGIWIGLGVLRHVSLALLGAGLDKGRLRHVRLARVGGFVAADAEAGPCPGALGSF